SCRARHVPLVFWVHDVPRHQHWTERLASRAQPELAIANSAFTSSMLHRLYPEIATTVVHPPVPDMAARTSRLDRAALRASFGAVEGDLVIVQASRLEESKGQTVLIDALARLPDDLRWKCLISSVPQRPQHEVLFGAL